MPAFFNSRDLQYRAPFGAVAEHTTVTLRVCMPRDWGCSGVSLSVWQDEQLATEHALCWEGMCGDSHEWWRIDYTPATAGLYWYAFHVTVAMGSGWLVRQADGTAA